MGDLSKMDSTTFQPSSTSVPSALHSTNSPYQWHCHLGHPSSINLNIWYPLYLLFLVLIVKLVNLVNIIELLLNFELMTHVYICLNWFTLIFGGQLVPLVYVMLVILSLLLMITLV